MSPGKLRDRCIIEYPSQSNDPVYGAPVTTWTELATRWGEVQDTLPSRSEKVQDSMVVSQNSTRLRLRFCTDVDSTMRVTVTRGVAVTYQIIAGPAVLGNKEYVEFMLERISTQ